MIVCFHCAKPIKGKMTVHQPARYLEALGVDFARSYHPSCYVRAEKQAEKELKKSA